MKQSKPRFIPTIITTLSTHKLLAVVMLCCISFPVFTIAAYYAFQVHRDINNTVLHELNIKSTLVDFAPAAELGLWNDSATLIAESLAIIVSGTEGSLSQIEHVEVSYSDGEVLSSAWSANTKTKELSTATQITHELFSERKRIGQINAYYRPVPFFTGLWPHLKLLILLMITQVVIGLGLLSLYVHFQIIRPMKRIGENADKIAEGDLSSPFPRDGKYELDVISRHLEETRLKAIGSKTSLKQFDA